MGKYKPIPPRKPWAANKRVPTIVAAHTDFTESLVDEASTEQIAFHEKRMSAKGYGIDQKRITRDDAARAAEEIVGDALWSSDGLPSQHVRDVYNSVLPNLKPDEVKEGVDVFLPVIARVTQADAPIVPGQISKNALATVYALRLAEALQEVADENGDKIRFQCRADRKMMRVDSDVRQARRDSDTLQRFSRQNAYSTEQFQAGEKILLVDDHVQSGASIKNQIDAAEKQGAEIVGVASFGALSESINIRPSVDVSSVIGLTLTFNKQASGDPRSIAEMQVELEKALALSGISTDSMTSRELLSLVGVLIDRRQTGTELFFNALKKELSVNPETQECGRDNLRLLDTPAISVPTFYEEMKINQIIEAFMSSQPSVKERADAGHINYDDVKPFIMVSAGGPAVGKSAMVTVMERRGFFPEKTLFLSQHALDACFDEKDFEKHFHPELLPEYYPLYEEAIARLANWAMENGYSVVMQDHMQDIEWMEDLIGAAKHQGYETYATGLFIDEATHRKHREDHNEVDANTHLSLQMMSTFAQNWEKLMGTGLFDYGILFHRIKQANAPEWNAHTTERIIKTAEYYPDEKTYEPTAYIYPSQAIEVATSSGLEDKEINAYDTLKRWQRIRINQNATPGVWEEIIEGENADVRHFTGRVVDGRATDGTGSQKPHNRFTETWQLGQG